MRRISGRIALLVAIAGLGVDSSERAAWAANLPQATALDALEAVGNRLIVKLSQDAPTDLATRFERGRVSTSPNAVERALDRDLKRMGALRVRAAFPSLSRGARGERVSAAAAVDQLRREYPHRTARMGRAARAAEAKLESLDRQVVLELDRDHDVRQLLQMASELEASELVESVELDLIVRAQASQLPAGSYRPNDPYLTGDGVHWSEGAFGNDFPNLYGLRNLRAFEAWQAVDTNGDGVFGAGEKGPGQGIVVAVVDTGLDRSHPDIAGNVWVNPSEVPSNSIDEDGSGAFPDDVNGWDFVDGDNSPDDPNGHGTHVSGTIAAIADNGIGIAGVAPYAKILPVRALDEEGAGSILVLANAILYATDRGADVISNSWGGAFADSTLAAAMNYAEAAGALTLAASGNASGQASMYPARLANVIGVAALDPENRVADFSNVGPGVEIAAPGVSVLSLNANRGANTIAIARPSSVVATDYLVLSGTSMACPHVAGLAAVMMSHSAPGMTVDAVRARMATGSTREGLDPFEARTIGVGRPDVLAALTSPIAPKLLVTGLTTTNFAADRHARMQIRLTNFGAEATSVSFDLALFDQAVSGTLGSIASGATATSSNLTLLVPALEFGEVSTGTFAVHSTESGTANDGLAVRPSRFESLPAVTPLGVPIPTKAILIAQKVLVSDYSGDGRPDLASVDALFGNSLFTQEASGRFELNESYARTSWGLVFADFDRDSDDDIVDYYAAGYPNNTSGSFANDGSGAFSDITAFAGLGTEKGFDTGTVIDLEGDGDLDLVGFAGSILGYQQQARVLENDGSGRFSDVSSGTGLDPHVPSSGGYSQISAFDYDEDGDQDLLLASPYGLQLVYLFENDGSGRFSEVASRVFLDTPFSCGGPCGAGPYKAQTPASFALGDFDNDEDIDVFLPGIARLPFVPPADRDAAFLFRNNGDATFTNVIASAGDLGRYAFGAGPWGTAFLDVDSDGDLDLHVGVDHIGLQVPGQTSLFRSSIFRNEGDGTFARIDDSEVWPAGRELRSHLTSFGDFDRDGSIDLYANASAPLGGEGGLLKNLSRPAAWVEYDLVPDQSNPNAIGARVYVRHAGTSQMRLVHDGPVDPRLVHFGFSEPTSTIDSVTVEWPSGTTQTLVHGRANRVRRILESAAEGCPGGQDSDADGRCNPVDNCLYEENGPNGPGPQKDSDLDGIGNACDADFDNDGIVGGRDFTIFVDAFGTSVEQPGYGAVADIDGDDLVSGSDFVRFTALFGQPPGPSGLACADASGATAPCVSE